MDFKMPVRRMAHTNQINQVVEVSVRYILTAE